MVSVKVVGPKGEPGVTEKQPSYLPISMEVVQYFNNHHTHTHTPSSVVTPVATPSFPRKPSSSLTANKIPFRENQGPNQNHSQDVRAGRDRGDGSCPNLELADVETEAAAGHSGMYRQGLLGPWPTLSSLSCLCHLAKPQGHRSPHLQ